MSGPEVFGKLHPEAPENLSDPAVIERIRRAAEVDLATLRHHADVVKHYREHGTHRLKAVLATIIFLAASGTVYGSVNSPKFTAASRVLVALVSGAVSAVSVLVVGKRSK